MSEKIVIDGILYTASNKRMAYTPEFCENHKAPWTKEDIVYLCSMWDSMKKLDIAMALGRTHSTVLSKAYSLRQNGLFDYYKGLGAKES